MVRVVLELGRRHVFLVLLAVSMVASFGLGVDYARSDPSSFGHQAADLNLAPLYIDTANDRVGIGSQSPGAQLEIGGTSDKGQIFMDSGDEFHIRNSQQGNEIIIYDGSGGIRFEYAGSEAMRVNANGLCLGGDCHSGWPEMKIFETHYAAGGGENTRRINHNLGLTGISPVSDAVVGGRRGIYSYSTDQGFVIIEQMMTYIDIDDWAAQTFLGATTSGVPGGVGLTSNRVTFRSFNSNTGEAAHAVLSRMIFIPHASVTYVP